MRAGLEPSTDFGCDMLLVIQGIKEVIQFDCFSVIPQGGK